MKSRIENILHPNLVLVVYWTRIQLNHIFCGDGEGSNLNGENYHEGLGKASIKKNVFFRALPESPNPPPLTPIWATWSFFFGRQNSLSLQKCGEGGRYINNLKTVKSSIHWHF